MKLNRMQRSYDQACLVSAEIICENAADEQVFLLVVQEFPCFAGLNGFLGTSEGLKLTLTNMDELVYSLVQEKLGPVLPVEFEEALDKAQESQLDLGTEAAGPARGMTSPFAGAMPSPALVRGALFTARIANAAARGGVITFAPDNQLSPQ